MNIRKPQFLNVSVLSKVLLIMVMDVLATAASFFLGLWFRYDLDRKSVV